jgi:Mn2+/Fe2+ NRAMP family transporter
LSPESAIHSAIVRAALDTRSRPKSARCLPLRAVDVGAASGAGETFGGGVATHGGIAAPGAGGTTGAIALHADDSKTSAATAEPAAKRGDRARGVIGCRCGSRAVVPRTGTALDADGNRRTRVVARGSVAGLSIAPKPALSPLKRRPFKSRMPAFLRHVGPGVVTGAADDDPSGIATYTQAGAQFGTGVLWTVFLTLPFMIAIQLVSARIGRQSGRGIAANLKRHTPAAFLFGIVGLLLVANTINIAADIAAMGEALNLVVGGGAHFHAVGFGVVTLLLQIFVPYRRLAPILKWLTLSLFVYVATAFTVRISWTAIAHDLVVPQLQSDPAFWTMIVAVFGTTISPYLFFWQASQEVEELRLRGRQSRVDSPEATRRAVRRMRLDTIIGMVFSNGIAFFVMLTGAVVLHAGGISDVRSAADAAQALRPLAGDLAFGLFAAGIVATGLLAVPVLASSAAYAVAEAFGWTDGLEHPWSEAKGFYSIIAVATLVGTALDFSPIDPMKALYWSAVINGVVAVPIMVAMMLLSGKPEVMGPITVRRKTRFLGWGAVVVMAAAVLLMARDLLR